jgi:phosphoglycolate phosphatase
MLRPYTSQGVRGLLKAGFDIDATHPHYERLSHRFLEIYASAVRETRLFDGIPELLDAGILESRLGHRHQQAHALYRSAGRLLQLTPRTNCVVSGDTTAEPNPRRYPSSTPAAC